MMAGDCTHHPRPAELESFLLGELPACDAARIVAHLLKGCETCSRQMEPLASVLLRPDCISDAPVEVGSEYDFPLFKAFAAARRYAAAFNRERREAERDGEDLRLREVPMPKLLDVRSRASRDWERCEQLLARCRNLRQGHPGNWVTAASLAISLAEQIAPEYRGAQALSDLQARAWSERGNARRVADDLTGAEADLAHAIELARTGSGNLHLLAHLLDLTASLRIDQRRFDDAFQLLDWVYAIHLELGERHEAGRALISKSSAAAYALDLEGAVRLLGQGLALIDADQDPHLVLAVAHNLSYHLMDEGRLEEARRLLHESRALCASYGGRIDQLKSRWLDGRIAMRLEDLAGADRAFREVRAGFEELGLPYDVALVSLELAEVWLGQGRAQEIQLLLDDTVATFRARGIGREALAALLMLRETAERQSVTTALLRRVAAELQRLDSESAASKA
jgi:hypothetical protein